MAVFFESDSRNTNAANAALELNYAVEEVIRPSYSFYKNGFVLRHVVGIDRSDLLAARTGVRGYNDIVWVGRAANYAAKYCAFSETPLWISKDVYDSLNDSAKYNTGTVSGSNMWSVQFKWMDGKLIQLYSSTYRKSF